MVEEIGGKAIRGKTDHRRSQTQCNSMWLKRNVDNTKMQYSYRSAKEAWVEVLVRFCYSRRSRAWRYAGMATSARASSGSAGSWASSILKGPIHVARLQTQSIRRLVRIFPGKAPGEPCQNAHFVNETG